MSTKKNNKKSAKNTQKVVAPEVSAEVKPEVDVTEARPEVCSEKWDRVIAPTPGAAPEMKADFLRTDLKGQKPSGVRFAKTDKGGRVIQVRVMDGIEGHWFTAQDAIEAGILPEGCERYTGVFTEYDAVILKVELMEELGVPVPDGVAVSYARAVTEKKAAIEARNKKELEIVNGGKKAYQDSCAVKGGKRWDKLAKKWADQAK